MGRDSEGRIQTIMDKLFLAPKATHSSYVGESSRDKKRYHPASSLAVVESKSSCAAEAPLCRPWDRDDLLRRLATFKSMTWFAKPKVVSAVNCARRGWINVEMDTIACESCKARMLFSTPSAWTQETVDKTALVFSLKLNGGHKMLCPWMDNVCDEELSQFPPTTVPVLIDCYRQRSSTLSQLQDLPVISASAVDYMRSPELEQFLSQKSGMGCDIDSSEAFSSECLGDEQETASANLYYQAQKLISLCGWEARSVPFVVDCKNKSDNSSGDACFLEMPKVVDVHGIRVFSPDIKEVGEEYQSDPNSVVLDCRLCGASVGLWAFKMLPRPVELLRLVGHADSNDVANCTPESVISNLSAPLGTHQSDSFNHVDAREGAVRNATSDDTLLRNNVPNLGLTIAGGPLPAKQNFRAKILLPIVGQNLMARLFSDMLYDNNKVYECSGMHKSNLSSDNDVECHRTNIESSVKTAQMSLRRVEDTSGPQIDEQNVHHTFKDMAHSRHTCIEAASSISKSRKMGKGIEFDSIRQHRHFCPWISATGDRAPGWKQTLVALQRQQITSSISAASIMKVDDPLRSIRKVFMSPPSKRKKLAHG